MRACLLASIALLASCAPRSEPERSAEDLKTFDAQEAPAPAAPGSTAAPPPPPFATPPLPESMRSADAGGPSINVTAAPGVAFNYRYAYRLPNARISAAQEAHAAMCEKLTITRCRITGMRYSLINERDVTASLELKLDPAIARQFGKEATKVITDSKGMLVDQQISGVDVAPTIDQADRGRAQLQDELDRVNRELARPGLSNVIRDRLLSEAQSLRQQIRGLGEQKKAAEDSLATTPMAFYYGSGKAVPGFDEPQPLADALDRAGYNFAAAIGLAILAIATLLPWALLLWLGYVLLRRFGWIRPGGYRQRADAAAEPHLRERDA